MKEMRRRFKRRVCRNGKEKKIAGVKLDSENKISVARDGRVLILIQGDEMTRARWIGI